ncbi:tripartite tricarboxylate transporter TctB family protein [Pararhodobacter sp. CCB-MM2]|uniref:tripartite tricarboxylate transporter TctB family protein n=1 Tax=Pararhodobacter sp. CCB-MM2 TaxID=1786003 RepID=UPI0008363C51|nr:tripartite tricarboxylate transporter TctB family protein [Pararhodobacter sp. CCB-MM2]
MTKTARQRPPLRHILTSKSGLGALLLFLAAAVTFSEVAKLRLGTASAMGPGYFPALLGGLFVLFGLILAVEAWQKPDERLNPGPLKPALLVMGAIVLFALLYRIAGGALAITGLLVVSALAEPNRTLKELALLVLGVIVFVWLVFVLALDLQFDMLPTWLTR